MSGLRAVNLLTVGSLALFLSVQLRNGLYKPTKWSWDYHPYLPQFWTASTSFLKYLAGIVAHSLWQNWWRRVHFVGLLPQSCFFYRTEVSDEPQFSWSYLESHLEVILGVSIQLVAGSFLVLKCVYHAFLYIMIEPVLVIMSSQKGAIHCLLSVLRGEVVFRWTVVKDKLDVCTCMLLFLHINTTLYVCIG